VVNEERSAEELERLLAIANATIAQRDCYIELLEEALLKLGAPLPAKPDMDAAAKKAKKANTEDGDAADEDEGQHEDLLDEVHDQKLKLKKQAEHISEFGRELALAMERLTATEAENQELLNRINDTSAKHDKMMDERQEQLMKYAKLEIEKGALEEEVKAFKEQIKGLKLRLEKGDAAEFSSQELPILRGLPELSKDDGDVTTVTATTGEGDEGEEGDDTFDGELRDSFDSNNSSVESLVKEVQRLQKHTADLEKALAHEKRKSAKLKEMFKDGEQPLRLKMSQLDRHFEQLTSMYHKLVSQNSALKVECQVNEKKIQRKEHRIGLLEKTVTDGRQKYERLLSQCAALTVAVEQLHASGCAPPTRFGSQGSSSVGGAVDGKLMLPYKRPKINKPLKGGQIFARSPKVAESLGSSSSSSNSAAETSSSSPPSA